MSRDSVLALGRTAAEASMVDACTIRRRTDDNGPLATDPASGVVAKTYATVYTGKCRIQQRSEASAQRQDVGEDDQSLLHLELQLPAAATGFELNDEVTITASRDPDLVGRVLLVRDLAHKTDATARRIGVTERTD